MTLLDPVTVVDYKRDRWGRPLIVPANGGKAKPYTRASSAAKTIEDRHGLELWARRNVAFGMARDPSLVARVIAVGGTPHEWGKDEKAEVGKIVDAAETVAQAHRGADIGTAVHRIVERWNRGEPVDAGPYQADLDAYIQAVTDMGWVIDPELVECRMVCDSLEMAGTCDLIPFTDDTHHIADLKTGATVTFGGLGYAAQLAAYAHGDLYDPATEARRLITSLNIEVGYIIHLPAGTGTCSIYEVDLVEGYRAATLANEIRAIRKASKGWMTPVKVVTDDRPVWTVKSVTVTEVTPDRRAALLERYAKLADKDKALFTEAKNERGIDADDLDAIEALLDECDPFRQVVEPVPVKPAAATLTAADIDEGDTVTDAEYAELGARVAALDDADRDLVKWVASSANAAGYSFSISQRRTRRRWLIGSALISLVGSGWDETLARTLAAHVTGDDACLQPGVSLGAVFGALTIDEAGHLSRLAVAFAIDPDPFTTPDGGWHVPADLLELA